jgi:hypothetical protein
MDNRYHLMIDLSIGVRQLSGIYTQKYIRRHHKASHVFQGIFKRIVAQKEITFLNSAGIWS